ncbi:MAG: 30S ribosomal protein S7 [Candidatus Komeilibacteria bacterium RIFCSPLOWO2_01_FULL_45_10]|uniref:Small ribosomal subunit protein uS7 n=1 Tax=Candidatus Komeilibacteria bacterium RIFCSPLOWO2_01_FULL_45_10 TaxID=1798550 RepID=A0A1G2BLD5_9BACT|nr:MAG: 30S ribosomal protein S7 [Candidatus Komeilibacteria bacterium RIFCSPLOWO2_01_FULL_45_10]
MRSKPSVKRKIAPDPKFNSVRIAKLINYIMRGGKKTVAQKVVYDALDVISAKTKGDPLVVFEEALKNVSPQLEVKSRRIGGANYQIPMVVSSDRRLVLAYRWLINAAQTKKGKPMAQKLAEELIAAAKGEGEAVKKREDVHRMAEANRAFAHFA